MFREKQLEGQDLTSFADTFSTCFGFSYCQVHKIYNSITVTLPLLTNVSKHLLLPSIPTNFLCFQLSYHIFFVVMCIALKKFQDIQFDPRTLTLNACTLQPCFIAVFFPLPVTSVLSYYVIRNLSC
jgi:hypothetical protein